MDIVLNLRRQMYEQTLSNASTEQLRQIALDSRLYRYRRETFLKELMAGLVADGTLPPTLQFALQTYENGIETLTRNTLMEDCLSDYDKIKEIEKMIGQRILNRSQLTIEED